MEPLADPFGDRVVNDFPPPPVHPISDEVLYPNSGKFLYQYFVFYPLVLTMLEDLE